MNIQPTRAIVLVVAPPLPSVGGIQTFSNAFIDEGLRQGLEITVISTTVDGAAYCDTYRGAPIYRLRSLAAFGGRFPIPSRLDEIFAMWRLLRASDPRTIVVIQGRFYLSSLAFTVMAAALGRACTIVDHGAAFVLAGNGVVPFAAAMFERVVTVLERLCGARFFAISQASSRFLQTFGIYGAPAIGNGVARELVERTVQYTKRIPLEIVYCGRLLDQKGILELLAGFALAEARFRGHARLTIVGDGPLRDRVEAYSRSLSGVRIVGAVGHRKAIEFLADCDVVVSPSNYPEGFPSVALEAGALGRALCATVYGGGEELVVDGENALVLNSLSADEIARAIERLSDVALRKRLGSCLRSHVSEHYTWPVIMRDLFLRLGALGGDGPNPDSINADRKACGRGNR